MIYIDCDNCGQLKKAEFQPNGTLKKPHKWYKIKVDGEWKTACSNQCLKVILSNYDKEIL